MVNRVIQKYIKNRIGYYVNLSNLVGVKYNIYKDYTDWCLVCVFEEW